MNNIIQLSVSFSTILWHALENATKCSLTKIVPLPYNLGKWSLNFGRGLVVGFKFKGEDTCQGVALASSSNYNKPYCLIIFAIFVMDWIGLKWLYMIPIKEEVGDWDEEVVLELIETPE